MGEKKEGRTKRRKKEEKERKMGGANKQYQQVNKFMQVSVCHELKPRCM